MRRLIRGTAALGAAQLVVRAASLVAFWALTDRLEAHTFGLYQYALQVTAAWAVLAHFHLRIPLVRGIAREPERTGELVAQVLALRLVLALVVCVAAGVWCLVDFDTARERGIVALLLGSSLLASVGGTFEDALHGREAFELAALAAVCGGLLINAGTLAGALVFGRPIAWAVGSQIIGTAVNVGLCLGFLRGRLGSLPPALRWNGRLAQEMLRLAVGVAVAGQIGAWYGRFDLLAVREFLGDTAAGRYGVAFRALDVCLAGVMSLHAALLPSLARAHAAGPEPLRERVSLALRAALAALVPAAGLVSAYAPQILRLFRADYAPAAGPLAILIWVVPLTLVGALLHWLLYLHDRPWRVVLSMAAGLATVLVAVPVLLRNHGLPGAAAARLLGEMAVVATAALLVANRQPIPGRPSPAPREAGGARWSCPAPTPGSITIGIVAYNALKKLRLCLRSISEQRTWREVEIVVVDNASREPVPAMVRGEFPRVRLIEAGANLGFAAGTNLAFGGAQGELLWLLNPDCELPEDDTLERLAARLESAPDVGALSCRLILPDGTDQPVGPVPTAAVAIADLLHASVPRPAPPAPGRLREAPFACGACLLTRAEVWRRVGGLDPAYHMYFEDADWCLRVAAAGWRVAIADDLAVRHHEGASYGGRLFARREHAERSLVRLVARREGPAAAGALRAGLALSGTAKLLAAFLTARGPDRAARLRYHLAQVRLGLGGE